MAPIRTSRWSHREELKEDANRHNNRHAMHPQVGRQIDEADEQEREILDELAYCRIDAFFEFGRRILTDHQFCQRVTEESFNIQKEFDDFMEERCGSLQTKE